MTTTPEYCKPDLDLLAQSAPTDKMTHDERQRRMDVMGALVNNMGVRGRIVGLQCGPVLSDYRFLPDDGVRIDSIRQITEDIARALATDARISIERRAYSPEINIMVPNVVRNTIRMGDMIYGDEFPTMDCQIPWLMGALCDGAPAVFDLGRMEHVLITGGTGAGKSTLLQSLMMSVVYNRAPTECQLVVFDTKAVDFAPWAPIGHLAMPIVTDAADALRAMQFITHAVDARVEKLRRAGVANIDQYTGDDMPTMIVIVDELADLVAYWRDETVAAVHTVVQFGARVGIHLVAATRRGDIADMFGYISSSIMFYANAAGACNLLDWGDVLVTAHRDAPVRVHTAYLDAAETSRVVDAIQQDRLKADLYARACQCVMDADRPTISYVQRCLQIGYNTAAALIERMERQGLVSAPDENGRRHVNATQKH